MEKTTKHVRGIHSLIKFQKHQGVESLSIEGKQALADLSQDKNGDTTLILNADADKLNTIHSDIPFISVSEEFSGVDPNQLKTATISQDLTLFPLSGGELVTVTKENNSLTIHDEKVKEFVNTTLSAKETELKEFVTEQTAGAVGVSPSYVSDEIRKAKEELTVKINELSSGNQNTNAIEIYKRSNYYSGNCAKFKLPEVSTGVSSILNISTNNRTDTFYIAGGTIDTFTQNGVIVDQGNAADMVDWTITLPFMSSYTKIEIISFGYPYGKTPTENWETINIEPDTSYTPAPIPQ